MSGPAICLPRPRPGRVSGGMVHDDGATHPSEHQYDTLAGTGATALNRRGVLHDEQASGTDDIPVKDTWIGGEMGTATQPTRGYAGRERRIGYPGGRQRMRSQTSQRQSGFEGSDNAERRSRGLGWFSIALGLVEVAAPRALARAIGVPDDDETRDTLFAVGLREIASGMGILSRPDSAGWLWARVGGDVMDLALLGSALRSDNANPNRIAAATAAVVGVTAVDYITGQELRRGQNGHARGWNTEQDRKSGKVQVTQAITINRPVKEVYGFWRNFRTCRASWITSNRCRCWTTGARIGGQGTGRDRRRVGCRDHRGRPDELIAWRSLRMRSQKLPDRSASRGRRATRHRDPRRAALRARRAASLGATIAKLFGEEPGQQVKSDLRASSR